MVILKTNSMIKKIRLSCRLASQTLDYASQVIQVGQTTKELDELIYEFICSHDAIPASLGYNGFPGSSCISINEVVVHGIPGPRVINAGDVVKVDVTTNLNGYFGDTARTFLMEPVSDQARKLTEITKKSMDLAIQTVRPGSRVGDIGATIQGCVEKEGFSVVRDFVGHGVGLRMHEHPAIPHYGKAGEGMIFKTGMIFTIEPMINAGAFGVKILGDKWTAVTIDGQLSAQFEHAILVTEDGHEILTIS
ncbi:MAG: type I methionyl aminopeptidase [Deltaproteobacteria bacterium]|jgi:methionyl aminopeptidase|nr:type I methionyl aminopeptidase [Deltaproteobacteria bacterium]